MKIPSCSVTWTWLTKSARVGGRRLRSRSSTVGAGVVDAHLGVDRDRVVVDPGRADAVGADRVVAGRIEVAAHRFAPGLAQGPGEERLGVVALEAVEQLLGLERLVAEVDEAVAGQRAGVAFLGGDDRAGARLERARRPCRGARR